MHNNIESLILGSLLLNLDFVTHKSFAKIRKQYFFNDHLKKIFETIQKLTSMHPVLDFRLISSTLPDEALTIAQLMDQGSQVLSFEDAVKALIVRFKIFELEKILSDAQIQLVDLEKKKLWFEFDDLYQKVTGELKTRLEESRVFSDLIIENLEDEFEAFERFVDNNDGKSRYETIPTGFRRFDEVLLGGIRKGTICTVGAFTGRGKTIFGVNVGIRAALSGYRVLYVNVEQDFREIFDRILADIGDLPLYDVINQPRKLDFDRVAQARRKLYGKSFHYHQIHSLLIEDVSMILEHAIADKKPYDLVVIDYIQKFDTKRSFFKTNEKVGAVSNFIKQHLALKYKVGVLSLAQMNRQSDAEGSAGLRVSNIGDSSGIERDSDVIAIIGSEDKETVAAMSLRTNIDLEGMSWFKIAKNRNGQIDSWPLKANMKKARFEEYPDIDEIKALHAECKKEKNLGGFSRHKF